MAASWALGAGGYALGLAVANALDWPPGPVIVWSLVALALATHAALRTPREKGPLPP